MFKTKLEYRDVSAMFILNKMKNSKIAHKASDTKKKLLPVKLCKIQLSFLSEMNNSFVKRLMMVLVKINKWNFPTKLLPVAGKF